MDDIFRDFSRDDAIQTAVAVGILLGAIVIARIIAALLQIIVHRFTHATETRIDDLVVRAVRRPLLLFVVLQGAVVALRTLSYLDGHRGTLERVWVAFSLLLAVIVVQRLTVAVLEWYSHEMASRTEMTWDEKSLPMIRRILNVTIFAVGGVMVLGELGISISPLLAGIGLGGLAVALALQPMLSNVFAGSYVLSDGSIGVGDFIEMEGGPTGWVEDIGWRATRIRTFDNNFVIIPNSTLADATVTNFDKTNPAVGVPVICGVAYEEDLEHVEAIATEVLQGIIDEFEEADGSYSPVFRYQRFGDSNIDFLLKIQASNRRQVGLLAHTIVKRIHTRFAAEGITINYPARRLILAPEDAGGLERLANVAPPVVGSPVSDRESG